METVKEYKKGNKVLKIYQDDDPSESPREWDNLGIMVCFHDKYNLGDSHNLNKDNFETWQEVKDYLIKEEKAKVILPLRIYDHSGVSISTTDEYPYNDNWDSSFVGYIYTTNKKMKEEGIKEKKAEKILKQEVEIYNQYLNGEVYGYKLMKEVKCKECKNIEEEEISSCWGFIGELNNELIKDIFDSAGEEIKKYKEVE